MPNKKLAQDVAEKLYAGVVAKTRAAKAAEKEREPARIKKEEERAKSLSLKDPGTLMRELMKEIAGEEVRMKDESDHLDGDEADGEAVASKAAEVGQVLRSPENDAPEGAAWKTTRLRGDAAAKAKAKAKAKGKAEAKAKPAASGGSPPRRPPKQEPQSTSQSGGWNPATTLPGHRGPKQHARTKWTASDEYKYPGAVRKWRYWPGQAPQRGSGKAWNGSRSGGRKGAWSFKAAGRRRG